MKPKPKYKLVCFDLDGTLIDEADAVWSTIHFGLGGTKEEREHGIKMHQEGKFSYSEWAHYDLKIWQKRGATKDKIVNTLKHVRLMPGTIETLKKLKEADLKLAVISGGLSLALEIVLPNYKDFFDDILINTIAFDNKNIPQEIIAPFDATRKDFELKMIADREKFKLDECVFVGDHDNDVHACQIAGLSIAFCPNSEKLKEVCHITINKKDMREILKHILTD